MLVEVNLVDLSTRIIQTPGLLVGQPSFLPDGSIIVFAIPISQVYLGLKFCLNRLNGVYLITGDGVICCITSGYSNARSPRVFNNSVVFFLTVEDGTTHFSASKLIKVDGDGEKVVVDINWGGFPSQVFSWIYLGALSSGADICIVLHRFKRIIGL